MSVVPAPRQDRSGPIFVEAAKTGAASSHARHRDAKEHVECHPTAVGRPLGWE